VRSDRFLVSTDRDFAAVIGACAAPYAQRSETWINRTIETLCLELHASGQAHSVEAWLDGHLVGGLYGIELGGAFFGESMFSTARDASKVALVHLVARLLAGGFKLLDTQFVTHHLTSLGAVEIDKSAYRARLASALACEADFLRLPLQLTGRVAMQLTSQAS
jgi:leucyl/phenylalanyl-tRNA--protein transferase